MPNSKRDRTYISQPCARLMLMLLMLDATITIAQSVLEKDTFYLILSAIALTSLSILMYMVSKSARII